MIEFLTLLLGLVAGRQTVEISAEPPVVAVELRLDGRVVERRDEPPWRFEIDLGPELVPHELLAVGLDAGGGEVAGARQWLNLPRGAAEARLVLDLDAEGWPAAARLTWASLWSSEPEAVEIWFDGGRLEVADPRRFELPRYDRQRIHVLAAELRFAHGQRAHAEASFGGVFGERIATELTAVPVITLKRGGVPRPAELRDAFRGAGGQPLEAVSVETGGADVVVVRDRASQLALSSMIAEVERRMLWTYFETPKDLLPLRREDRIRFVWPEVTGRAESGPMPADPDSFAVSAGHGAAEGGLHWLLSRVDRPPVPQRIADAAGVAALSAAAANRARGVVLIVDPATPDRSEFSAAQIRRYLARLHVPLVVWTPATDPGPLVPAWGEVESVATWRDLQEAVRRLRDRLDRQSIVWLEGSHLPQTIRLADGVRRVSIACAADGEGDPRPVAGSSRPERR